jgi:hypothetical protein
MAQRREKMIDPEDLVPASDLFMKAAQEILNETTLPVGSSSSSNLFANNDATSASPGSANTQQSSLENKQQKALNTYQKQYKSKLNKPHSSNGASNFQSTYSPFGYNNNNNTPYNSNNKFSPFYSNFAGNFSNFGAPHSNNFGFQATNTSFFSSPSQTDTSKRSMFNNRIDYEKAHKAQVPHF